MRVISGSARGTKLVSIKGMKIRPTSDQVKEAIFNIIAERIQDSYCLDLYAGTGALGIEALSRGGAFCMFVDDSPKAIKTIKKNLEKTKFTNLGRVVNKRVEDFISDITGNKHIYDLIFLDPPYKIKKSILDKIVKNLVLKGIVKSKGLITVEYYSKIKLEIDAGYFKKQDTRRYGHTSVSFYKKGI